MFTAVNELSLKAHSMDFSSAGLGVHETKEVIGNGWQLFNSINLLEYDQISFQALVCRACGITGCEPGSWVSLRRAGEKIVLIPAVMAMLEGKWELDEYFPPSYLIRSGPLSFTYSKYEELRSLIPKFPSVEKISQISSSEIFACHKMTVPGNIFGQMGVKEAIKTDCFLTVSEGDLQIELSALEKAVDAAYENVQSAISSAPDRIVEFYFDLPNYPIWGGFGYENENPVLLY